MDVGLRNRLWDAVSQQFLPRGGTGSGWLQDNHQAKRTCVESWHGFFKQPRDTIPTHYAPAYSDFKGKFYALTWSQVYDLIEWLIEKKVVDATAASRFVARVNTILEEEKSAYRIIGEKVTPVTRPEEMAAVEQAMSSPLAGVNTHIGAALGHLSRREGPDFRNSIKESISAVEAVCKTIVNRPNATLGDALDMIDGKVRIHPAMKGSFSKLYGYTSSADGIRHSLMDEPKLELEDAMFMLVSCSAFVNYLVERCRRVGITLGPS